MLVAGRVVSGIAVGLASASVPLYQSEITAPAIRGRLVSMQQWSITWGIFLQYFVEFGCSYIDGTASFRVPWGLQMIPAIILSLGMLVFPEVRPSCIPSTRHLDLTLVLDRVRAGSSTTTGRTRPSRSCPTCTATATRTRHSSSSSSPRSRIKFASNALRAPSHIPISSNPASSGASASAPVCRCGAS